MADESNYRETMPGIKHLFQTRHYLRCVAICEQLLSQSDKQIHPVHRASVNFYLALSHDSLAREAGMRNRDVELQLAEKHYLATISDLTPSAPNTANNEDADSPTSSESDSIMLRRRPSDTPSLGSDRSTSTAATSVHEEELEILKPTVYKHVPKKRSVTFADIPSSDSKHQATSCVTLERPMLNRINTHSPASSQHEQISADLSSFISLVKSHLASVHELKASPPGSRNSPSNSRPASREMKYNDNGDGLRWQRKRMTFRPRFDPTSVQKLCAEALAEL